MKIPSSDGKKKGFAFITFCHVASVPYTIELMSGTRLFDQQLRLQTRPGSIHERGPSHERGPVHERGPPALYGPPNQPQGGARRQRMPPDDVFFMGPPGVVAFNPLAPPLGAVLAGTNFHRSLSSPSLAGYGGSSPQHDSRRSRPGQSGRDGKDRERDRSIGHDRSYERQQHALEGQMRALQQMHNPQMDFRKQMLSPPWQRSVAPWQNPPSGGRKKF